MVVAPELAASIAAVFDDWKGKVFSVQKIAKKGTSKNPRFPNDIYDEASVEGSHEDEATHG